jgi:hypothetical protein
MTKEEATEILCYIAQEIISPLVLDSRPASEVVEKEGYTSTKFNELTKFIHGMVKENENHK